MQVGADRSPILRTYRKTSAKGYAPCGPRTPTLGARRNRCVATHYAEKMARSSQCVSPSPICVHALKLPSSRGHTAKRHAPLARHPMSFKVSHIPLPVAENVTLSTPETWHSALNSSSENYRRPQTPEPLLGRLMRASRPSERTNLACWLALSATTGTRDSSFRTTESASLLLGCLSTWVEILAAPTTPNGGIRGSLRR